MSYSPKYIQPKNLSESFSEDSDESNFSMIIPILPVLQVPKAPRIRYKMTINFQTFESYLRESKWVSNCLGMDEELDNTAASENILPLIKD